MLEQKAQPGDIRSELRRLVTRRTSSLREPIAAPAGDEIADGLRLVEDRFPSTFPANFVLPWGEPDDVDAARLVCFDTETTGLAGGVGTKAFMIGTAQYSGRDIRIRQWYLTAMRGEAAMLEQFIASLPADPIFVSYNGRSYDAPLLKGRFRMHHQAHPFEGRHVDLLYPTRRAYRGNWENCRLQTIERHALGIVRHDDLPGSEAPAAWLSFLRGESSVNLWRVLAHNRQDVITLQLLLQHLCVRAASADHAEHGERGDIEGDLHDERSGLQR